MSKSAGFLLIAVISFVSGPARAEEAHTIEKTNPGHPTTEEVEVGAPDVGPLDSHLKGTLRASAHGKRIQVDLTVNTWAKGDKFTIEYTNRGSEDMGVRVQGLAELIAGAEKAGRRIVVLEPSLAEWETFLKHGLILPRRTDHRPSLRITIEAQGAGIQQKVLNTEVYTASGSRPVTVGFASYVLPD